MKQFKLLMLAICSMAFGRAHCQDATENSQTTFNNQQTSNEANSCTSGCCCGNNQAPLGVMTDHIHAKGTWMLSYTYMDMMMKGNRIGSANAPDNTVYQNYMMAPETMDMQMHMVMLMYGITDRLTIMAMGGYSINTMSMNMSSAMMNMPGMVMPMGNMSMLSSSSGFADMKLSALYNFSNNAKQRIIGSLGVNVPTGTIDARGTTMLGDNQRLPYDMQPGTGSYSVIPGITYVRSYLLFSYGADAGADIKLNSNTNGYKDGNVYHVTAWAGYRFLSFLSGSVRGEYVNTGKITGADSQIAIPIYETNDPTTKTSNYGGQVVNAYIGLNFHFMTQPLKNFTFRGEYGIPVYQNLNGTQMASHSNILAGLQYAF